MFHQQQFSVVGTHGDRDILVGGIGNSDCLNTGHQRGGGSAIVSCESQRVRGARTTLNGVASSNVIRICFDSDSTCGTRSINLVRNSGVFEVDSKGVGETRVKSDGVSAITCECDFTDTCCLGMCTKCQSSEVNIGSSRKFLNTGNIVESGVKDVESAEILMTSAVPSPAAMVSLDKRTPSAER